MNKKWIYAVCLAASLTLLLTACGGPTTDIASSDADGAGTAASESLSQESAVTTESSSAVDAAVEENAFSDADTKESSSATTETAATVTQRREEAGAPSSPSPTVEEKTTAATSHTTAAPSTTRQPAATKPSSSSRPTLPTTSKPAVSKPTSSKPTTTTTTTTAPPASDSMDRAEQVTALVNAERAKAGLPALTLNRELSANATVRAREIINSFSHTRPNGSSFSSAITLSYRTAGENIAYGYSSAESVMNGWMNSAGHKANILKSSYTQIGVGVVENRGTLYWVQLFIG